MAAVAMRLRAAIKMVQIGLVKALLTHKSALFKQETSSLPLLSLLAVSGRDRSQSFNSRAAVKQ
jgi:hypothetical protein